MSDVEGRAEIARTLPEGCSCPERTVFFVAVLTLEGGFRGRGPLAKQKLCRSSLM